MSELAPVARTPTLTFQLRLLSDERLARLAADGDERAFAQIFARHQNEIYRYCRGILAQHEDAQDALQATMAAALRSLPGERREIKLKPWLYRVAHNEAIAILRRRRGNQPETFTPGLSPAADEQAESRERLRQLVADLDSLPERQRGALTMRELSGMSYEEVSAVLEISAAAARQAVYEARMSLQVLQEGREMRCEQAQRAISEQDGRILRGRKLRSHIRGCDRCSAFEASISQRRRDFQMLSPALPGAAGAGLLAGLFGGEATRTVATSGAVKALATIGAAAAIGTGAAGISGAIHVPGFGGDNSRSGPAPARSAPPAARSSRAGLGGVPGNLSKPAANGVGRAADKRSAHAAISGRRGVGHTNDAGPGSAASNASGAGAPTTAGSNQSLPDTSHGQPPSASNAGGNSAANAHGANAGGNSAANSHGASANAGGSSANAHGANAGGNSAANSHGGSSASNSQAPNAPGTLHSQSAAHSNSPVHASP